MPNLSQELESLRRRARVWTCARGVAALLAVAIGLGVALGVVDALARWQSLAGRVTPTLIWLAAILVVSWRYLVRPLRTVLTDLDLSRVIHRQWPLLTPDLTSAVEFNSSQLSSTLGAPLLQQVTVSRAQLQLATVPWRSVVAPDRTYGVVAGAGLALLVLGLTAVLSPEMTRVGGTRLVAPLVELEWPRRTTLVYLNSELEPVVTDRDPALRVGQGEPLTLYIENLSGALPAKVLFDRQPQTGEPDRGELRQTTLRDKQGHPHAVAVASLPTTEPFQFRVHGDDDDRAPWIAVDVVPTPRVQSFEITITPPSYTGRPVETTTSGVGHLQGLVGSQVEIRCRAVASLKSVILNTGNDPRKAIPLDTEGLEFTLAWTLATADRSTYWLDLVDPYGLRAASPPRYEIRGVADQEPVVSLLAPTSDVRVTALAEIPIEGEARDDLGLQRVELVYELPVMTESGQATTEQRSIPLNPDQTDLTEQSIRTTWNLAELALVPGSQVRFWLQATDAYNLNGSQGQVGRSATRIVSILSMEEKQQELSGRQMQIAQRIAPLQDRQAIIEQTTREIGEQWKTVGTLRSADESDLDRVQAEQKEIARELAHSPRSILADLKSLQQEMQQNRLAAPAVTDALAKWESALTPLADEVLPSIEKQLEASRQGAVPRPGLKSPSKEQTTAALDAAHDGQQRVLDDLAALSTELAQWQRGQGFQKKFADIAGRQAALREQSLAVGKQTSGKTVPALSTQEQADLARAADRQTALARDVEQLTSQLAATPPQTEKGAEAAALAEMAQRLSEQSVAATMRGISDELRQNHVQAATDAQQKLIESLETLRKTLDQERSQTAQNEVEELRKSIAEAAALRQKQAELRRRTEALPGPTSDSQRATVEAELLKLQKEIEQQTSDLAQRLRRERHEDSASAANRASDRMREAGVTLEQDQVTQSLERQTEALDELEQVRESLGEELQDASYRADQERLSAVTQLVIAILERAKSTRDETIRVEELRVTQGKWTRSQLKSVQGVADSQRDVANSTQQAGEELGSTGVMGLCLNMASEHFTAAAKRLDERDAGQVTQAEQRAGETLLEQFIASLPSSNTPSPPLPGGEQPAEGQGGEQKQSSPLLAVEVRLLLRMQEELLLRTRTLADLKAGGHELTADQIAEFRQLKDRQKKLVETARLMLGASPMDETSEGQP
jgi:hypothetical protein